MSDHVPEESVTLPPRIPPWRRRVSFYLLVAVAGLLAVYALKRVPVDVDVTYVLSALELGEPDAPLLRDRLIAMSAEIFEEDELLARSTFSFRVGGAPKLVAPPSVRLRSGSHLVHLRLVFDDDGERRVFAVNKRFEVTRSTERVTIDFR